MKINMLGSEPIMNEFHDFIGFVISLIFLWSFILMADEGKLLTLLHKNTFHFPISK